ncbi:SIMPL domain-containing protein [Ideonella sp.]|jgi:predicted secreted protein|uniref:SIMPL domain-containing protein n=1 Tax=Ideonella sp. TaxID=1929293 RepID=UPI0037BED716
MTITSSSLRARRAASLLGGALSVLLASGASAQAVAPQPQGVLNLSATATVDVPKDWMMLVLSVAKEGSDANAVQNQLKVAVDSALVEARKQMKPGQLEVQTGAFSIFPRYNNKGVINGWQGSTEVQIQGRDMATIGQLTGKIASMTIANVSYSVSRETREKMEAEVTAMAIARFKAQAELQAKAFGYAGYSLREVSVAYEAPESGHPMPMRAMKMAMADAAPEMPVEAGKGSISATVSGSVQLK